MSACPAYLPTTTPTPRHTSNHMPAPPRVKGLKAKQAPLPFPQALQLETLGETVLSETAFNQYTQAIRRTPLLSAKEELRLGLAMQTGDKQARTRLLEANLLWIVKIARWYAGKVGTAHLEDFVQMGNLAVLEHLDQFEPQRARFTTWAAWWAYAGMSRGAQELQYAMHIPEHVITQERRFDRLVSQYEAEHGQEPSLELLSTMQATLVDTPRKKSRQVLPTTVPLDTPLYPNSERRNGTQEMQIEDALEDDYEEHDPVARAERRESLDEVALRIGDILRKQCTAREREVLLLFYGDDDALAGNYSAIGKRVGCSRQRVEQLYKKAILKIRQADIGNRQLERLYDAL